MKLYIKSQKRYLKKTQALLLKKIKNMSFYYSLYDFFYDNI